jgi:hypothetical protein
MAPITIACVYKTGGDFTREYVTRLRDGVAENVKSTPYRFVCLTDDPVPGVDCEPLVHGNRGWWAKLELFRFTEPTVYFDLDTIIRGEIDDIVSYPHKFTALMDFYRGGFASGFMAWSGDYRYLNRKMTRLDTAEYERHHNKWGDQGYIRDRLHGLPALTGDLFPGRFVSYKQQMKLHGGIPKSASVLCFHGRPRPTTINWSYPTL